MTYTGENEPVKNLQNVVKNKLLILLILSNSAIFANFATLRGIVATPSSALASYFVDRFLVKKP